MKKRLFLLVLAAALMIGCPCTPRMPSPDIAWVVEENETSRTSAGNSAVSVSGIEGNEWKLVEVYINGRNTSFSRNTLPEELKNFFTVNFDAQNVSGIGAPNRYSAPYTKGGNQTISIMLIRSTQMAAFLEPEKLKEHDFFIYMQNASSWKLNGNNLELFSKTPDGVEVRLVFSL